MFPKICCGYYLHHHVLGPHSKKFKRPPRPISFLFLHVQRIVRCHCFPTPSQQGLASLKMAIGREDKCYLWWNYPRGKTVLRFNHSSWPYIHKFFWGCQVSEKSLKFTPKVQGIFIKLTVSEFLQIYSVSSLEYWYHFFNHFPGFTVTLYHVFHDVILFQELKNFKLTNF